MSFGEFLWSLLIIYVMIAYFMVLFSVIVDVFRNHESSGFTKAIWIIALVFFPILSLLIYVIVNGQGMTERTMATRQQAMKAQDDYVRQVAGSSTPADQIARAQELLSAGKISQEDFNALKAKALA